MRQEREIKTRLLKCDTIKKNAQRSFMLEAEQLCIHVRDRFHRWNSKHLNTDLIIPGSQTEESEQTPALDWPAYSTIVPTQAGMLTCGRCLPASGTPFSLLSIACWYVPLSSAPY